MLPRDEQLLEHILDYCEDILGYLRGSGNSRDAFLSDTMIQHSVSFCIPQIGELAGRLSDSLRSSTRGDINWTAIKGMRNIVVHDYGNVDLEEVWFAATQDVPKLKAFCEAHLEDPA